MSSIPDGICSKGTNSSSSICKTFRPKPTSLFIIYLFMLIEQKPSSPAIPATGHSELSRVGVIIVPDDEGLLVFLMFTGIPL